MKNKPIEISSRETELINKRFLIKASVYNATILLIVQDMVENNFKMQYFSNPDLAANFIKLLKTI